MGIRTIGTNPYAGDCHSGPLEPVLCSGSRGEVREALGEVKMRWMDWLPPRNIHTYYTRLPHPAARRAPGEDMLPSPRRWQPWRPRNNALSLCDQNTSFHVKKGEEGLPARI
ncbi:hypothetical protein E2C01_053452 [Portunus trituberculatus]|uniref:Uncharacterized protein n=1 Tax=Portunus trituberculatus TaxID=210409 RepID=A0A5B7GKD4_PORTR|nr:hypothetical protein [Portunus trituberculatus]